MELHDNGDRTAKRTKPNPSSFEDYNRINLDDILPNSLKPNHLFKGKIIALTPYNPNTQILKIQLGPCGSTGNPGRGLLVVAFKGNWTTPLKEYLKLGKIVYFVGMYGEVEEVEADDTDSSSTPTFKVQYEKGVKGFYFDPSGELNDFEHSARNSTQDNKKKDVQTKKIQVKVNNTSQPTPAIGNASGQGRQHRKDVEKLGRNPRTEWGLETTSKKKYLTLKALTSETNRNLSTIAIARPKGEARKLDKGGHWTIALHLFDPSLEDNSAWVTVNFFDSKKFNLPDLKDGDAIVLSGLNNKVIDSKGNGGVVGYDGKFSSATLHADGLLKGTTPHAVIRVGKVKYGNEEVEYAKALLGWYSKGNVGTAQPDEEMEDFKVDGKAATAKFLANREGERRGGRRETVQLKDVVNQKFYDIYATVVKAVEPRDRDDILDLYISDFTENDGFFNYTSEIGGWDGPLGQRVLKCAIAAPWPNINKLKPKTSIKIQNLRILTEGGFLKGGTWKDEKYPDKPSVSLATASPELKERFDDYWNRKHDGLRASKVSLDNDLEEEEASAAGPLARNSSPHVHKSGPVVTCGFVENELVKIGSMRDKEEYHVEYHLNGQVTGWDPPLLNNWVKAKCTVCKEEIPQGALTCWSHPEAEEHYYEFYLRIQNFTGDEEDEKGINVFVSQKDFAKFLPGLCPTADNRGPEANLKSLRDRLRPIFGQIEMKRLKGEMEVDDSDLGIPFDFAVTRKNHPETNKPIWAFVGTRLK